MRLVTLGIVAIAACAGPRSGALEPARANCSSSVPTVERARATLDTAAQRGDLPALQARKGAPANSSVVPIVIPELITNRTECEAVAYELMHTPSDARNIIAFRYGDGFLLVYDSGALGREVLLLDAGKQMVRGFGWLGKTDR